MVTGSMIAVDGLIIVGFVLLLLASRRYAGTANATPSGMLALKISLLVYAIAGATMILLPVVLS
jgi:hypothetical protein